MVKSNDQISSVEGLVKGGKRNMLVVRIPSREIYENQVDMDPYQQRISIIIGAVNKLSRKIKEHI